MVAGLEDRRSQPETPLSDHCFLGLEFGVAGEEEGDLAEGELDHQGGVVGVVVLLQRAQDPDLHPLPPVQWVPGTGPAVGDLLPVPDRPEKTDVRIGRVTGAGVEDLANGDPPVTEDGDQAAQVVEMGMGEDDRVQPFDPGPAEVGDDHPLGLVLYERPLAVAPVDQDPETGRGGHKNRIPLADIEEDHLQFPVRLSGGRDVDCRPGADKVNYREQDDELMEFRTYHLLFFWRGFAGRKKSRMKDPSGTTRGSM